MAKRLTASEYMMTLYTIFMFALVAAGFVYGYKLGSEDTAAKIAQAQASPTPQPEYVAYHQDHLSTFYYTVWVPVEKLHTQWFETKRNIILKKSDFSTINDLSDVASESAEKLKALRIPSTSPLLISAQNNYLKSLTLFKKVFDDYSPNRSLTIDQELGRLQKSPEFEVAVEFMLTAQEQFFESIVKWNQRFSEQMISGVNEYDDEKTGLALWKQMNLNVKNVVSAYFILRNNKWEEFLPTDLTARVEEIRATGNMKANTVQEIMRELLRTQSVRAGDFERTHTIYFENAEVPGVPFLFKNQD